MSETTDRRNVPGHYGRYRVLSLLGEGAMGAVFLAEDPVIGRRVAVKVLRPHEGLAPADRDELLSRFEREFRAAGNLSHPHIVTVHDVGRQGDASYIAMEYVDGETLRTVLGRGRPLSFLRVIELIRQVGSALDYAHSRGIIHRDVKPANVLLGSEGDAKIADFGIAKLSSVDLTRTGIILGTPAYMSPEQVTDQKLGPAADQFSLAVMAYQMLTGKRPFGGENPTKTLYQIAYDQPEPATQLNRDLSPAVDAVLRRAMAKKPEQRFPSCRAFAEALAAALSEAETVADGAGSPLATQRIRPPVGEPSDGSRTLPQLEDGPSQPPLIDSVLTSSEEASIYAGPPPLPAVKADAADWDPGSPPRAQAPPPPPREPEILPVAEPVVSGETDLFGAPGRGAGYRFWQAAGMVVALLVGLGMWSCWGTRPAAGSELRPPVVHLLDSRPDGRAKLPTARRDDQPRLPEEPSGQRDHAGATSSPGA